MGKVLYLPLDMAILSTGKKKKGVGGGTVKVVGPLPISVSISLLTP